jgi:hypothetical protein
MAGFENRQYAARCEFFLKQVRDLLRHPFLDLRFAGDGIDDASKFAQAHNAASRNVSEMRTPGERQQVMLAEARELNVFLKHQLFVIHFEGFAKQRARVRVQASECFGIEASDAAGRVEQAFAVRVLADRQEQFTDSSADAWLVNARRRCNDRNNPRGAQLRIVDSLGAFQESTLLVN